MVDFQKELQSIWDKHPCHIVRAGIGNFSIHLGSIHALKDNGLLNDEV